MKEVLRIKCPDSYLSKDERVFEIYKQLKKWVYSDALQKLLDLYDINIKDNGEFKEYVTELQLKVSAKWDYRANKKESWLVKEDNFAAENAAFIMNNAKRLGFVNIGKPILEADYICPLGGARLANLHRCLGAKAIVDKNEWKDKKIIALSATRPIDKIEIPYIEKYINKTKTAKEELTEYDIVCLSLEKVFNLDDNYVESGMSLDSENINERAAIRRYLNEYNGCKVYSLAAPSSDPVNRRANSVDTFNYLLKQFNIKTHEKILLTTNYIYQPRQLLSFIMLSLEHNINVDCIGVDNTINNSEPVLVVANYLQEIKAMIDTVKTFCDNY